MKDYKNLNALNIQSFYSELDSHSIIAYDTETTGLNVRKDKVIGFSVSCKTGSGWYLPLYVWNKELRQLEEREWELSVAKDILLELQQKKLIMHNASFDIRITFNFFGINLINSLHADTQLMKHTLAEDGPFALKENAIEFAEHIGLDNQDAANQEQLDLEQSVKLNGGKWTQNQKDMYMADLPILSRYAIADTDITLRLFYYFEQELLNQNLHNLFYVEEVMPLYKLVTIKMEHRGVYLDIPKLTKYMGEIELELKKTEKLVVEAILETEAGKKFVAEKLDEEFPTSGSKMKQAFCVKYNINLPKLSSGKYQLTKKTLNPLYVDNFGAWNYLVNNNLDTLYPNHWEELQMELLLSDQEYPINIGSKAQLGRIVFEIMGIEPLTKTAKGVAQFNEDFVEHLAEEHKFLWAKELRVFNKLTKIKSSYFERFLEQQEDGIYYPSFKQHGTTSGRYSSDFQQLPRPKEEDEESPEDERIIYYTNVIRSLVIPKPNYVFIDDDYESLEPRVFADDAGDQALIDIFIKGEDFYSKVGIGAENLKGVSADKKAPNFLKKINPVARQNAKAYALGIRYGLKNFKLSKTLNISKEEAQAIIDGYFSAYPNLKAAMDRYTEEVKTKGTVTSKFGRVRHLPRAREIHYKYGDGILDFANLKRIAWKHQLSMDAVKKLRKEYNNLLNNALNFPIQSAATSVVNRAAVAMSKVFLEEKLDAWVSLQIHDQIVVSCGKNCIDRVKEIVQNAMENTNLLAMPLIAKPEVAMNLKDGH